LSNRVGTRDAAGDIGVIPLPQKARSQSNLCWGRVTKKQCSWSAILPQYPVLRVKPAKNYSHHKKKV
jgi:hypothetical protein